MRREIDVEDKNLRNNIFIGLVGFLILILLSRLFWLQVLEASVYKEKALENSIKTNVIKSTRGQIFDKEGKILAQNTTGYKLIHKETKQLTNEDVILLKQLGNLSEESINEKLKQEKKSKREKIIETINDIKIISIVTGYTIDYIIDKFQKEQRIGFDKSIVVIEDLDKNIALKAIEKVNNERIDIVEYNKRLYPQGSLASHVIGNVKSISPKEYEERKAKGYKRDDLIGKKGIERQYDEIMKGKDGEENVEVDVRGNLVEKLATNESIPGKNIYLSIDLDLQKYMTQQFSGKTGIFIALEANTGKVITYVSSPEIDLNVLSSKMTDAEWKKLVESPSKPLVNKGVSGLYPPGSTFKVVSGMAILESGIGQYETVLSTGTYKYGKTTFRDSHKYGHGITNFAKSIEESVNTYYYVFSQRAGLERVLKEAKEFGVGEKTGIDVPGEQKGVLPTPEWKKSKFKNPKDQRWLPGDLINMSIGQGFVLMTPMQVAMVYQAIANDGVLLKPTFVDRFVNYDGTVEMKQAQIVRKLSFKKENLDILRNALRLPVVGSGGTARLLDIPGYQIFAKTGTAQNTGFGDNHSWIAGYLVSGKSKIVFVSIVEGGGYGGIASGRLAREFALKYRDKYELKKNIFPSEVQVQPQIKK